MPNSVRLRGFTLIEMVMVIVILGVVASFVAVFMRGPIDAYLSGGRRAALTDEADTTARRVARDIRTALPNSIRTPNAQCLTFIPTKTGGRYRFDETASGLSFILPADSAFNMLGSNSALPAAQKIGAGDVIVVYNLGIPGADAYLQDNTSVVTNASNETSAPVETLIVMGAKQFPLASPSNRFHVVPSSEKSVAYVCNATTLRRTASTSFSSSCAATGPVIATNVDCANTSFDYSGQDLGRNALLRMVLKVRDSTLTETVTLQHEVNVNNTP